MIAKGILHCLHATAAAATSIAAVKFTDDAARLDTTYILAALHATSVTSNVSRVFVDPAVIGATRCCPASLITSSTTAEVTDA